MCVLADSMTVDMMLLDEMTYFQNILKIHLNLRALVSMVSYNSLGPFKKKIFSKFAKENYFYPN